jgi:hypothetical protein
MQTIALLGAGKEWDPIQQSAIVKLFVSGRSHPYLLLTALVPHRSCWAVN